MRRFVLIVNLLVLTGCVNIPEVRRFERPLGNWVPDPDTAAGLSKAQLEARWAEANALCDAKVREASDETNIGSELANAKRLHINLYEQALENHAQYLYIVQRACLMRAGWRQLRPSNG